MDESGLMIGGTSILLDERLKKYNENLKYNSTSTSSISRTNSITSLSTSTSSVGSLNLTTKSNKEIRTNEALAMKDEQMRILGDQNSHLLNTLNQLDDELNSLKNVKLNIEEENRILRDQNFEMQSKTRAAEKQLKKNENSIDDKEKQVKILADHNTELLRLLENQEAQAMTLGKDNTIFKKEIDSLKGKYNVLVTTAKNHEEIAAKAIREGQLRAEEVRILRAESEQLKSGNSEMKLKTQVELESLHEQLRVRKEKQYQLLEKLQVYKEGKRQEDDQIGAMEDKLRSFHEKNTELDMKLQVEIRGRRSQIDLNKTLHNDVEKLANENKSLIEKTQHAEQERNRIEAEARDSGDQLREMAEKVFQLLERLKLSEIDKTKGNEALKRKDLELLSLQKKNSRLLKEHTHEGKQRIKLELDKKVFIEQIQALKKTSNQLNMRLREEVKLKLKEIDEKKGYEEKLKTLASRLSFLLNKMQADEEAKIIAKDEIKKMQLQIQITQEKNKELQNKLSCTGESNRIITEAMRCKQDELDELAIRFGALQTKLAATIQDNEITKSSNQDNNNTSNNNIENIDENSGISRTNGKFYVEIKANQGMYFIKSLKDSGKQYLESHDILSFLKKAQKSNNCKFMLIEKIAMILNLLCIQEEHTKEKQNLIENKDEQIQRLSKKTAQMQQKLCLEEDAKRKTLLRYVHAIKLNITNNISDKNARALQLPESCIGDEEVHAIAALLRNNTTITELNLRLNIITDEGARALAAVLSGSSRLHNIDLRQNRISNNGIRVLAEALERSDRIRHVYVHAGGKIEALGTTDKILSLQENENIENITTHSKNNVSSTEIGVETMCVVDVRDQVYEREEEDTGRNIIELPNQLADLIPMADGRTKLKKKNMMKGINGNNANKHRKEKIPSIRLGSLFSKHQNVSLNTSANLEKKEDIIKFKKSITNTQKKKNEAGWNGSVNQTQNAYESRGDGDGQKEIKLKKIKSSSLLRISYSKKEKDTLPPLTMAIYSGKVSGLLPRSNSAPSLDLEKKSLIESKRNALKKASGSKNFAIDIV